MWANGKASVWKKLSTGSNPSKLAEGEGLKSPHLPTKCRAMFSNSPKMPHKLSPQFCHRSDHHPPCTWNQRSIDIFYYNELEDYLI